MKSIGLRCGVAGILFGLSAHTYAVGVGLYVSQGSGDADFDGTYSNFSADTEQSAIGFTFDTNLSKNRLFNYRLGVEKGTLKFKNFGQFEVDEVAITNDFGFSMVREDNLRIWIGPELRISFQDKQESSGWEYSGVGVGLGPVVGLNWHLGQNGPSLIAKAGVLGSSYAMDVTDPSGWLVDTYTITQNSVFMNFGITFRINE